MQDILKQLARKGFASLGDVSVKIVCLDNGYGVETTVSGDRRYHCEGPLETIELAQQFALVQLESPRATQMIEPAPIAAETPVIKTELPRSKWNAGDLIADYKRKGIQRQAAYSQFVIDRQLRPEIDASEFFKYWDIIFTQIA